MGGGEGRGEVGDSRALVETHLTLPLLRNGPLPLPPSRAERGCVSALSSEARVWVRLDRAQAALEIGAFDRAHEGLDEPADFAGLRGGDVAARECPHDRGHGARDVAGIADRRQVDRTSGSRRGATSRSRQSRIVLASPLIAISMALAVSAPDSPSSNSRAASVLRFLDPRGRPAGLPLREGPPAGPLLRVFLQQHFSHISLIFCEKDICLWPIISFNGANRVHNIWHITSSFVNIINVIYS